DEDPVGNVVELAGATLQQQDAATENGCRLRVSFCGDRPALPAVQARRRAARTERDQRAVILGEKPPRPANVGTLARLSVACGERADGASAQDGDGALVDRHLFGCHCKLALPERLAALRLDAAERSAAEHQGLRSTGDDGVRSQPPFPEDYAFGIDARTRSG